MSADALIGRTVGDYKVVAPLGEGGMGMVYKGQHVALGQVVAVKSLHSTLMNNQSARDRFVREAQALARLNHPNIIGLLNFIDGEDGCFIVMEFAEGEDLEQKLQRAGQIPPAQCLPWFIQACRGLSYAHAQGIVHRDIKPSNIIVHPSGTTKLLDFGTAKLVDAKRLTQQGMTLGTVIYMSKEQLLGKPLDARSDVYSLGVTLYECVTGQLPFYDEEERKLVVKIAKEDPIPPSQHCPGLPAGLEQVILKALAKEPEGRFASAEELEQALAAIDATEPSARAPEPAAPPAPAPASPAPRTPGGASVLESVAFLAGVALFLLGVAVGVPFVVLAAGALRLVGILVLAVLGLTGFSLALVGLLGSRRGASGPAASPPAPTPRATPAAPTPGPAATLTAPPPLPTPVAAASPGGTLDVDSGHAAAGFGAPAAPPVQVAAGAATLQVTDGPDKGRTMRVARGQLLVIGRSPSCGLALNDPGVSGQHARFGFDGDGLYVEDQGSRNGVFVNNGKVQRQALQTGDLVVVGSTRILVNLA